MIELTVPALLRASAAVTAFTGARIYPLVLPNDVTLPAIHYSVIGGSASPTFTSAGSQKLRIEVNCWGGTYGDAVNRRTAVIATLNRYADGLTNILYLSSQDLFDDELLQYRAIAEFYATTTSF
jgi:hypothetical protein